MRVGEGRKVNGESCFAYDVQCALLLLSCSPQKFPSMAGKIILQSSAAFGLAFSRQGICTSIGKMLLAVCGGSSVMCLGALSRHYL